MRHLSVLIAPSDIQPIQLRMLAKSYGVDESAQTTHRELIFEPISPIDPFLTVPDSHANTSTRQTQGTEFFKVVYLDSPCEHHGTTEPLRVRKKSPPSPRIAGIGPSSTFHAACKLRAQSLIHNQVESGATPTFRYRDLLDPH